MEDGLGLTTVTALLSVVPTLSLAVEVLVSLVMGWSRWYWVRVVGSLGMAFVFIAGARVRGIRTRTEKPGSSVSNRARAWGSGVVKRTLPALYCVTLWAVCLRHSLPLQ